MAPAYQPPAYTQPAHAPPLPSSSRPTSASAAGATNEPVTYSSLSDLSKGRTRPVPPPPAPPSAPSATGGREFDSGYGRDPYAPTGARAAGGGTSSRGPPQEPGVGAGGRRMPPGPGRRERTEMAEPPRRGDEDTARPGAPAPAAANQGYLATAQSYVPKTVSDGVSSAGQTARDGFDSVFNQQRKEQVLGGAGKVAAGAATGAAKLVGKAAWQIGKFASR